MVPPSHMAQGTLLPKEILNPATAPRKGQHPGSAVPRVRLQCPVACPTPPELAKVTARGKALGLAWDHKFTRLSVWTRTSTDVTKLEVASDGSSLKYPAVRDVMINILCIYIYIYTKRSPWVVCGYIGSNSFRSILQ